MEVLKLLSSSIPIFVFLFIIPEQTKAQNLETNVSVSHNIDEYEYISLSSTFESNRDSNLKEIYIRESATNYLLKHQPIEIQFDLPYGNRSLRFKLKRNDFLSPEFEVLNQEGKRLEWEVAVFYAGQLNDDENSLVTMTIFDNHISIMVSSDNLNIELYKDSDHYTWLESQKPEVSLGCATPEEDLYVARSNHSRSQADCIELLIEVDYAMYQANGSNSTTATNWATSIFNSVSTIYSNEGVPLSLRTLVINNSPDNYTDDLVIALNEFVAKYNGGFNGQIAYLMSGTPLGGGISQGIGGYCNAVSAYPGPFAISGDMTVPAASYPTYSYNVMIVSHELGHVMGLRHTHACVWNGNNTQIDDCGNVVANDNGNTPEGQSCFDENNPILPGSNGTIMSRCDLLSGNAINLASGFGPEPGALLFNNFINASCDLGDLCSGIPPINDVCDSSIPLEINQTCISKTYDNELATSSGATPGFSCGSTGSIIDLWFTVIVPSSGNVSIETDQASGGLTNTVVQTYSGDCNNLTQLSCDDNSGNGNHALINLTNQTPGDTIYIRIIDSGSNDEGQFTLCAYDSNLPCHPDFNSLVAIYNALGGSSWNNKNGWEDGALGTDCDVCNWFGVVCDNQNRVIELNLPNNNLSGALPLDIAAVDRLEKLNIYSNSITDTIPFYFANMLSLTYLDLGNNNMAGAIPSQLGNCVNLNTLYLDNNTFTGSLPIGLELAPISTLWVQGNDLSGCIPPPYYDFCSRGATVRLENNAQLPFNGDYNAFCVDSLGSDFDGDGFCGGHNDCLDTNSSVYLGAPEICDGLDNDCDSETDEGLAPVVNNWLGGDNWSVPSNWSTGFIPQKCHDVVIDPGSLDSVIIYALTDGYAASIFVGNNGKLKVQNFATLNLDGGEGIINNGELDLVGDLTCLNPTSVSNCFDNNGLLTIASTAVLELKNLVDVGLSNNAAGQIVNAGVITIDSTSNVNGNGIINFGVLLNENQITVENIGGVEVLIMDGSIFTNTEGILDIK